MARNVAREKLAFGWLVAVGLCLGGCGGGSAGTAGGVTTPAAVAQTAGTGSTAATTTSSGRLVVVDTGQSSCYNASSQISAPSAGQAFYGQDAQFAGAQPSYTVSADGLTVYDQNTGLTWQRSPDTDGSGAITSADKLTWTGAQARPATLNAASYGGYGDWRLPTIKELYSLIDFRGTDPDPTATSTAGLIPFLDTTAFRFGYGDTSAGERVIDAQFASSTLYVSTTANDGGSTLFGVNFADGRIKGYGLRLAGRDKTFYVLCVRGAAGYGVTDLADNGDGTITDRTTGLTWSQADSGRGMNWSDALAWVQARNAANHLGHRDWRLPNAKELQALVDYTRSPDTTGSAAIDPLFGVTAVTNEAGQRDYPCYWTGTTHVSANGFAGSAVYLAFGRAMGYLNGQWQDVHGAGAQRSDPKGGNPADYPLGRGPQGDAVRILNYVRLVRG